MLIRAYLRGLLIRMDLRRLVFIVKLFGPSKPMNKSCLDQFDCGLVELEKIYRSNFIVDLSQVKPRLEIMCRLVEDDFSCKHEYLDRFLFAVDEIKNAKIRGDLAKNVHLLDFCMRRLRWPEIGQALKNAFPSIKDPGARLEVEALIKKIYDPSWEGGDFDFLSLSENIWE